jgi:curved DNA binding protein
LNSICLPQHLVQRENAWEKNDSALQRKNSENENENENDHLCYGDKEIDHLCFCDDENALCAQNSGDRGKVSVRVSESESNGDLLCECFFLYCGFVHGMAWEKGCFYRDLRSCQHCDTNDGLMMKRLFLVDPREKSLISLQGLRVRKDNYPITAVLGSRSKSLTSSTASMDSNQISLLKAAGEIATAALEECTKKCIPGANIMQLCQESDEFIVKAFQSSAHWPKVKGGVSFPTCISVNNVICHFSPCNSNEERENEWFWEQLEEGCVVKIELGAHVDGFPAMVGHSFVCGSQAKRNEQVDNLLLGTYKASQAVLGALKVGGTSAEFDQVVCRVAQEHGLQAVQGALTYQIGQNSFDLPKQVPINLPEAERRKMPVFSFEKGEIYVVDIVLSTGDGRIRASGLKPSVFRKLPKAVFTKNNVPQYQLKLSSSKAVIGEVGKKFGFLPFHLKSMNNVKRARIGMFECLKHGFVASSEILIEKPGSLVARYLYTVVIGEQGKSYEMITASKML